MQSWETGVGLRQVSGYEVSEVAEKKYEIAKTRDRNGPLKIRIF